MGKNLRSSIEIIPFSSCLLWRRPSAIFIWRSPSALFLWRNPSGLLWRLPLTFFGDDLPVLFVEDLPICYGEDPLGLPWEHLLGKHLQVFYGEDPLVFYVLFYYETTFGPSMEKIHWSSMSCTLGWSVEKALCSSMKRRSTGLPCRIPSGLLWRRPSVFLWRRPYGNFRSFLREFLLFYMGRASGFLCKNRGSSFV